MDPKLARKMRRHLQAIAREHGVRLHWTDRWQRGEAFFDPEEPTSGMAVVPRIQTPGDYLIGLHELGHILDENARRFWNAQNPYEVVLCESAAWAWAGENVDPAIRPQLTARDWDRAGRAWKSYLNVWDQKQQAA